MGKGEQRRDDPCRPGGHLAFIAVRVAYDLKAGLGGWREVKRLAIALIELPKIMAIGPQTAKACEKAGLSVTAVAKKADSEGIAQVVLQDILQAGNE